MIEVKNAAEAWREADRRFPTDYIKDEESSAAAGYPIYKSTADGNDSWISDLGTSLELNIKKGARIYSERIVIKQTPEIIEENKISASSVRNCCIKHNLYTCGTCRDYDRMLNIADTQDFSLETLYEIAEDICKHSEDQTIENVMFLLRKDAVDTFYTLA